MLVVLLVLTAGVSCSDDEELLAGNGIADAAWSAENQVEIEGGVLNYTFAAAGDWTARSSADWCEVQTDSGVAGESLLRLKVAKNTRAEARSATITVSVWGYASPVSFVVKQGKGLIEQGDGKYRSVNEWVAEYMKSRYLWNRAIENVSLDYSLCYDFFFFSILDGVAAQDDVNREDGHWQGQKRMYYYSRLESDAPLSRTPGEAYVGSGIYLLDATRLGDDYIGIVVMVVIPGTPAAEAGLVRGDFITAVNGEEVTESNYQSLGQAVYDGAVDVTVNSVTWTDNGTTPVLTPKGNVQLGSATFTSPAIYMDKVVEIEESDKKAGYLLYMGFDVDYDEELIAAFDRFRAQNVSDLILDLRYNNGGDVLSSTVLGTLIAGEAYKGQLYAHMTFNEDRTEAGESGDYKIGVKETFESVYEPIERALQHALGLKKIYVLVSETTASASEMVINGLRGLDIEVNLIGMPTNGKNVGMEGVVIPINAVVHHLTGIYSINAVLPPLAARMPYNCHQHAADCRCRTYPIPRCGKQGSRRRPANRIKSKSHVPIGTSNFRHKKAACRRLFCLLMKHCICFFSGDGTLERKLCALKVNIGCSALKALTRSALERLGAGKVNESALSAVRASRITSLSATLRTPPLIAAKWSSPSLTYFTTPSLSAPIVGRHGRKARLRRRLTAVQAHSIPSNRRPHRLHLPMSENGSYLPWLLPELIALCEHFIYRSAHEERLLG